ncbi:hypothetical protein, partial [Sphingorhabdus sp.]|uniref:hypothetical protein n=1 Tax=Sphingorhabdus sp. TaxID=1902408 RepID=UPI003593C897
VCHVNAYQTADSNQPIPFNLLGMYCQLFCGITPLRGLEKKTNASPINQLKCHHVLGLFRFGDQIAIINHRLCYRSIIPRNIV